MSELPLVRAEVVQKGERGFICVDYSIVHPRTGTTLRPTDQMGAPFGLVLADWFDQIATDQTPSRCSTCAFRRGTVANASISTIGDAVECLSTNETFHCHHGGSLFATEPQGPCAGYVALRDSERGAYLRWLRATGQTQTITEEEA